jgi:hypothetical protein
MTYGLKTTGMTKGLRGNAVMGYFYPVISRCRTTGDPGWNPGFEDVDPYLYFIVPWFLLEPRTLCP